MLWLRQETSLVERELNANSVMIAWNAED
jgi:hypothetical protein